MIYIATHKSNNWNLKTDKATYIDVRNCRLDHTMYSELAAIDHILKTPNLPNFIGVAHYRRFMVDNIKDIRKELPNFKYGFEYGKQSRPTIEGGGEVFDLISGRLSHDLGQSDMLVLKPFKKRSKHPLHSLEGIGWLEKGVSDEFYLYLMSIGLSNVIDIIEHDNEHICNNIMYSRRETFIHAWSWIMDIVEGFERHLDGRMQTNRMYGYFAEYLMKPYIVLHGIETDYKDSICIVRSKELSQL